jgi:hypothetical protein
MTLMGKVCRGSKRSKQVGKQIPVIWLAKLVLWVLQDDCMVLAWHLCDNHVCGTVAISASKKKTRKSKK